MVNGAEGRQGEGTDSIAVGNRPFVEEVKAFLRFQAKGTETTKTGKAFQVREAPARCLEIVILSHGWMIPYKQQQNRLDVGRCFF